MQKSNKVEIRLTDLEKKDWQEAAGGARLVSSWVRSLANAECARLRGGQDAGLEVVEKLVAAGAEAVERKNRLPLSTANAIIPDPRPVRVSKPSRGAKPAAPASSGPIKCSREQYHRTGVYCGACKQVIK